MKRLLWWRLAAVSLVATAVAVAATSVGGAATPAAQSKKPSGKPIIIGDVGASTGIMASLDEPSSEGVKLAIQDVNAKGGVLGRPLQYVHVDGKSDPNEGAHAAIDVLDKGASLVVVPCDFDIGAPAAIEAEKRGVISFSQCGASTKFGRVGIGPHDFTMATSTAEQGSVAAEFAYMHQHWKSAWTLLDTSIIFEKEACGAFATRFEQLGGKVVGKDTMVQTNPQIGSQITRLKSLKTKPAFLMVCTYQPGLAQVIRQIRAAGIKSPIYGFEDTDGYFWHKAVPGLKDVWFGTYGSIAGDDSNPAINKYFKRFKAAQGSPPPTSHSLTGYSIVQAYAYAANKIKSIDGDKLADFFENDFHNVPLLVGKTSFSKEWHVQLTREWTIMRIVGQGHDKFVMKWRPKHVVIPKI